jgi:hypothetical protein
MNYSIIDIVTGAKVMANSVFGKKREYTIQFNKESDRKWYVDFPGWPFDHGNLLMVAGADDLCEFLSLDGRNSYINVIPTSREEKHEGYAKLTRVKYALTGGAIYKVENLPGFDREIWLCPVTLFVLGKYPKYMYIKRAPRR